MVFDGNCTWFFVHYTIQSSQCDLMQNKDGDRYMWWWKGKWDMTVVAVAVAIETVITLIQRTYNYTVKAVASRNAKTFKLNFRFSKF